MWVGGIHTFENNQDQADIPQSHKGILPRQFKDVGQRFAEDDSHCDLADDAGPNHLCRHPFRQGQEEEERDYNQNFNN